MFLVRQDRRTVVQYCDRRWDDTDIHTICHRMQVEIQHQNKELTFNDGHVSPGGQVT
jgi:hypothetical protein